MRPTTRSALLALLLSSVTAVPSGHAAWLASAPGQRIQRLVARITAPPWETALPVGAGGQSYTARYSYSIPRATADRADMISGRQVHVVYMLPADAPDENLDTLGVIDVSVLAQNAWFAAQTASTGSQEWKYDTFQFTVTTGSGTQTVTAIDVTFLRTSRNASAYAGGLDPIVEDMLDAGLDDPMKRYVVYAAAPTGGVCGEAYYPISTGLGPVDGQYSAIFLDSVAVCGARDFATSVTTPGQAEAIVQHEMVHNDGVAPSWAPHHCVPNVGHICTTAVLATSNLDPERTDLMFPYANGKLSTKVLDRDRDDYYKPLGHSANWDLSRSLYLTP